MGDHMHGVGEWMLSYRYMYMSMNGNRDGTSRVPKRKVLLPEGSYMVAPTSMDMEMHMFGLMYAPADWLTLMAMVPVVNLSMEHETATGVKFTTTSNGVGDLKATALLRLLEGEMHRLHFNFGVGFPTGSIDEKDTLPTGKARLPYPMQLGSGTFDLLPGLTYIGDAGFLSWGAQALGTVRLHENSNDYTLGDRVDLTAWVSRPWTSWLSTSARVQWSWWGDIRGADPKLNPAVVPTADPDLRGGNRLDLLPGVNFYIPLGPLGKHRFAVEGAFPVYRWLEGPQLETDWRVVVGWQKAFGSIWPF
jgi:hypothetical protein